MTPEKPLNFIENLIEEDLKKGFCKKNLRFRFPPEPNGYLHIGHAAAICLNFGLGKKYNAPVNLRFDDTNPEKEEIKYVKAIIEDIEWLGFKWDTICYASDYFEKLFEWAKILIKKEKAYVDSQNSKEIAMQKGTPTLAGKNSPFRNRSIEENLDLFEKMQSGFLKEGSCVLRAKIDMSHPNMHMRDPIMYRIIDKPHHRTGNQWKIYPMYDWTHGQSDYIEHISHSFCTLEFNAHRELYNWFVNQISDAKNLRPKQREFARRDISFTVMSKRKLAKLIENGIVSDWDDPRMPTISGLRRRGYTPTSIIQFSKLAGIAKRNNTTELSLLQHCLKLELEKIAPRRMCVLEPLEVVIENYEENKTEWIAAGRKIPFSKKIYIERADFKEAKTKDFHRWILGGNIRLKHAYILEAKEILKNENGKIKKIIATYDPLSKSGSGTPESQKKTSTLHWVCGKNGIKATVNIYENLFTNAAPDKQKDKDFLSFVNKNSLHIKKAIVEPALKNAKPLEKYQFIRKGYFCVDIKSNDENLIFNKTVGLTDKTQNISLEKNKIQRNAAFERVSGLCGKFLKSNNENEKADFKKQILELAKNIPLELITKKSHTARSNKEILRIVFLLKSGYFPNHNLQNFLEQQTNHPNKWIAEAAQK